VETRPPSKKTKRGKNLSPRNMKACRNIIIALMQSVAEIGTQSTMKRSMKTLHELSPHIPPKTPKRNISSYTNEMLHTNIPVIAQRTRVGSTHAKEAKNSHQIAKRSTNSAAIGANLPMSSKARG
jgi:hypothetical protein